MKKLILVLVLSGFSVKAEAATIPGGIVYSDGKNAIYYDLEIKESKSLTADLEGKAIVGHPFAISDNGKTLLWVQNSRFYVRELPIGIPYPIQYAGMVEVSKRGNATVSRQQDKDKKDFIWNKGDMKNMAITPDGARFGFDSQYQGISWIFTDRMVRSTDGRTLPFYAKMPDSYNGIYYLSTILHIVDHLDNPFKPRWGNLVETPPASRYMASRQDLPPSLPNVREVIGTGGELDTSPMLCYKSTLKKSGHYLCFQNLQNWEKGNKLGAFIFQMENQWGPIVIRTFRSKTFGGLEDERQGRAYTLLKSKAYAEEKAKEEKCREWEIRVSFKTCEGLNWKPDGSLTVQSSGDLYIIDGSKIKEGMAQAEIRWESNRRQSNEVRFFPVNNVFSAEPRLVDRQINARRVVWVSDDSFLFQGQDMTVWLWNNGVKEKFLASPIPSQFYYCSRSPLANLSYSNEPDILAAISGKDGVVESMVGASSNNNRPVHFNIGPVRTSWTGGQTGTPGGKWDSVHIWIKEHPLSKTGLEFALPGETNLDDIKDPRGYEYRTEYKYHLPSYITVVNPSLHTRLRLNEGESTPWVDVTLGKIIILKSGNNYAALKPVSVKLGKTIGKTKDGKIFDTSIPNWMDYEWKLWKDVPDPSIQVTKAK